MRWKLEELAREVSRYETGIPWEAKGFRKAVLDVVSPGLSGEEDDLREIADLSGRFVPDGHYIDHENGQVILLEIEDTSRLTPYKLGTLIDLWFILDAATEWSLFLFVADRYGRSRMLDLATLYCCEVVLEELPDAPGTSPVRALREWMRVPPIPGVGA